MGTNGKHNSKGDNYEIYFYCPNCDFTGSDIQSKIYNPSQCPECKHVLKYTGMSQDEWREKTQEDKDSLKSKWKKVIRV